MASKILFRKMRLGIALFYESTVYRDRNINTKQILMQTDESP